MDERALKRNPSSCYLAGRLAQTLLDLGNPAATAAFKRVLRIIDGLDEQSLWTHADAATAAVAAASGCELRPTGGPLPRLRSAGRLR